MGTTYTGLKIKNTYGAIIKVGDNSNLTAFEKQLSDGLGNNTGLYVGTNNRLGIGISPTEALHVSGNIKSTATVEAVTFSGDLNGTINTATTGVTQSAGNNSTKIATTAYVDSITTAQDIDFSGTSGTGSVDLDSQVFAIVGTSSEIETTAGSQQLQIGLPNDVTIGNDLTVTNDLDVTGVITTAGVTEQATQFLFTKDLRVHDAIPAITLSDSDSAGAAALGEIVWIDSGATQKAIITLSSSNLIITSKAGELQFGTNSTNALTIDTSQNSFFAGDVYLDNGSNGAILNIGNGRTQTHKLIIEGGMTETTVEMNGALSGASTTFSYSIDPSGTDGGDLNFVGEDGTTLILTHDKNATFSENVTVGAELEFGSLTSTTVGATIGKFVTEAQGIASNDNDTSVPTSAAVKDYVDTNVTAQDLDFSGTSGTGSVDLDSQTFAVVGTTNEIETSASSQTLTIGLPSDVTIGNDLTVSREIETFSLTVTAGATIEGLDATGQILSLTGSAPNDGDLVSNLNWTNTSGSSVTIARIAGKRDAGGTNYGSLVFSTANNGTLASALSIDQSQNATFTGDLYIPSYIRHTGDTNTYIGFSGNDTIDLVTDSNVILRIDSSGNSTFAGTITGTTATFIKDQNADSIIQFYNANAGAAAQSTIYVGNSAVAADALFLGMNGTGMTTAGGFVADGAAIGSGTGASGGLTLFAREASSGIKFYTGGHTALALEIDSSQDATFAGKVTSDALELDYNTSYYNQDKTISAYSASNYVYVNGIGGASGQGLRLTSEGAATNQIGLENSNNSIFFNTNSTLALTLDSSQNATFAGDVGIGVAATKALQVSGEALFGNGTDGLLLSYSGGNSSGIIDTGHSSTALEFRVGNTQELLINGTSATFAGDVGIGTSDIDFELQVGGTDLSGTGSFSAQFAVLSEATTGYPSGFIFKAPRVATSSNRVLLNEDFGTYFSSQVYATSTAGAQSDIPIVFAPLGGYVGIGTTSPTQAKLCIDGTQNSIYLTRGGVSDTGWTLSSDSVSMYIGETVGGYIMTLREDGHVGIGTTAPNTPLHVSSSSRPLVTLTSTSADQYPGPIIYLNRESGSPADSDYIGAIYFDALPDAGALTTFGRIKGAIIDASDGDEEGAIVFDTTLGGDTSVEAMRIVGGNVGIGTTSPSSKLVVRTSTDHNFEVEETGGELRLSALNNARSANIGLQFAASEFNFLTGNVGIGTTSPTSPTSVSTFLEIEGTTAGIVLHDNGNDAWDLYASGGKLGTRYNNAVEGWWLDASGNMGIGTTSPDWALDIEAVSTGVQLQMGRTTTSAGSTWMGSDSTGFHLGVGSYGVGNSVSDPNGFTIDTNGRIGISKTPTTTYGSTLQIQPYDSASNVLELNQTATTNRYFAIFTNPNGGIGSIQGSGTTTSYGTSSDYRLKENVVEMTGALDRVNQLKPSRFNFISDADKTLDGFLAHEVQDIVPEAITGEKDATDNNGNPQYQQIDQSKLVPLLVGAIQELKAEIETLKTQINK